MTLSFLASGAPLFGELLGLLALFLSPELERGFLVGGVGLGAMLFFLRLRPNDRWLLGLLAGTVVAALGAIVFGNFPVATSIFRGLVAVHILLWLGRRPEAYRFWRLGVAFFELILAAILSPETHMFLIIFGFAMISSLSLSFAFLERKMRAETKVPAQFLFSTFLLTFVTFLSSLLIFPILPRSNWQGSARWTETGYTETIDFRSALSWGEGSSRPLIWVFLPEGESWAKVLPRGLIRGAVLDAFDGDQWRAGARQANAHREDTPAGIRVQIFREPLNTNLLPVPYGTAELHSGGRILTSLSNGEWPAPGRREKRAQYEALIAGKGPVDSPREIHRTLPDPLRFPEITKLAANFRRNAGSEVERVRRVLDYFASFKAGLAARGEPSGEHPVEVFVRKTKDGHCELFATAAALLFREMGMPARVVSGFRVSPTGSVVVARNTDAHAWVEVWLRDRGWVVIDVTPMMLRSSAWPGLELYEYLNAYWHRYILGYEFEWRNFSLGIRPWLLAIPLLIVTLLIFFRRARRRQPPARFRVTKILDQMEKKLRKKKNDFFSSAAGQDWLASYASLRFGPAEPGPKEIAALTHRAKVLIRSFFAK